MLVNGYVIGLKHGVPEASIEIIILTYSFAGNLL